MIVLIGGEKGGTGKSTLTQNLASWLQRVGREPLLVDCDKQATSATWAARRAREPGLSPIECVRGWGVVDLADAVRAYSQRYDDVLLDAGGQDSAELRSAMCVADVMIAPLRPAQASIWTVKHLAGLVKAARGLNPSLRVHVVITQASTNWRVKKADQARELVDKFDDLELMEVVVHTRGVYDDAMTDGRGVVEMSNRKARAEIEAVAKVIYNVEVQETVRNNAAA